MKVLQTMENPRHYGPITSLCIDKKRAWIVVGTSTGILTLWDKRFGLLIRSWHAGAASSGKSSRIYQCHIHPSKGRGKWIVVTLESPKRSTDRPSGHLIEVWDIEKAMLVESFTTRIGSATDPIPEPRDIIGVEAETSPAAAIAALVRSRQQKEDSDRRLKDEGLQPPTSDIRALVVGSDFGGHSTAPRSEFSQLDPNSSRPSRGFLLSGSDDGKIRLWDLGKFDRTSVLSGVENDYEKPSYRYCFLSTVCLLLTNSLHSTLTSNDHGATSFVETWPPQPASSSANRPPQRISLITHSQQNLLNNHRDVITALACIDSPFRGGIVSGDRTGMIKIWRVEQVDSTS